MVWILSLPLCRDAWAYSRAANPEDPCCFFRAMKMSAPRMSWSTRNCAACPRQDGFTLLELVMVILVVSIVAAVSFASWRPASSSVNDQADQLARDLRHAQMLALTWGRALRVTATSSGYSVTCVTAGTAPCVGSPPSVVTNPSTNMPFSFSFRDGVVFNPVPAVTDFDSLGRPKTGAAFNAASVVYTLSGGGNTSTVTLSPLTGFVAVAY